MATNIGPYQPGDIIGDRTGVVTSYVTFGDDGALVYTTATDIDVILWDFPGFGGTPRAIWDESEDSFAFSHGLFINADIKIALGSITSASGTINFGTNNLTTGGTVTADDYVLAVTDSDSGQIVQNSARIFHTFVPSTATPTHQNVFIGANSGNFTMDNTAGSPFRGTGNVGLGSTTLQSLTTGYYNFACGTNALTTLTTGHSNVAIGHQAGDSAASSNNCVFIGRAAGGGHTNGAFNICIGRGALSDLTTGDNNVGVGSFALADCGIDIDRCIAIGDFAGRDEDTDDRLIIDNRDRGSAAATRTNAILYGIMAAAPEDQILNVNAKLTTAGGRIVNTTRIDSGGSPYTLLVTDHHLFCDTDDDAIIVLYPAGVAGTEYRVVNTGSSANNVTLTPNGAELLLGVNSNFTLLDGEALLTVYEATEGWY